MSRLIARQIGLLIDRQGRVEYIIVGDTNSIMIPELARERSSGRLRGLRLLHTHLNENYLSREDLMDMLFLRLDSISVLTVDSVGSPKSFQSAHLLPQEMGTKQEEEPYRLSPITSWDAFEIDLAVQIESLEEEFNRIASLSSELDKKNGAILVSVTKEPKSVQELHLTELAELARTAGLQIVGQLVQRVSMVHHRQILSKAKIAELEVLALQGNASLIIFDRELTPAQLQNLTDLTERKVLDRTQLILDIFAQNASTSAGKLQVEMAQLRYTLPRLAGENPAMDRLMGGVGGRGPGETKLETDRRRARERIARIQRELNNLKKQRLSNRSQRQKKGLPLAALVGYTNAGKSTLLNQLTKANVLTENKLFATLDPTSRRLRFPKEREIIVADTVGFIRELPKDLMEAFRATLEELNEADLLLHVIDASHPEMYKQLEAVENILVDLGLQNIPRLLLLNKWDVTDPEVQQALLEAMPDALPISAQSGEGLVKATESIENIFWGRLQ